MFTFNSFSDALSLALAVVIAYSIITIVYAYLDRWMSAGERAARGYAVDRVIGATTLILLAALIWLVYTFTISLFS
jgi:hypothetical protein